MKITFIIIDKISLEYALHTGVVDPSKRTCTIDLTTEQLNKINKKDTEIISNVFLENTI